MSKTAKQSITFNKKARLQQPETTHSMADALREVQGDTENKNSFLSSKTKLLFIILIIVAAILIAILCVVLISGGLNNNADKLGRNQPLLTPEDTAYLTNTTALDRAASGSAVTTQSLSDKITVDDITYTVASPSSPADSEHADGRQTFTVDVTMANDSDQPFSPAEAPILLYDRDGANTIDMSTFETPAQVANQGTETYTDNTVKPGSSSTKTYEFLYDGPGTYILEIQDSTNNTLYRYPLELA